LRARSVIAFVAVAIIAAAGWYYWPSRAVPENDLETAAGAADHAPVAENSTREAAAARAVQAPPHSPGESAAPSAIPAMQAKQALTPENRENLRIQTAIEFQFLYEDLGEALGLDKTDAENLVSLLIEQRLEYADAAPGYSVAESSARAEFQAQQQREIEAQIGVERARKLAEYQRSLQVRYEVENVRKMLWAQSLPLSDSQRKDLIRRGIAQGAYAAPTVFTGAESEIAMTQEQIARNEIAQQRLLNAARDVLTAEQFARMEEHARNVQAGSKSYLQQLEQEQRRR